MSEYRRYFLPSATYFFTVITYNRQPIFAQEQARTCLRNVIKHVKKDWPFTIQGFVLLPNHLHTLWSLPEGDTDYPIRWKLIKANFTREFLKTNQEVHTPNLSRKRKQERIVWQRRYWEHVIRNEKDFQNHLEYIHYNPVKHGYVDHPKKWQWSTFHRYVEKQWYDPDWGNSEPNGLIDHCVGE